MKQSGGAGNRTRVSVAHGERDGAGFPRTTEKQALPRSAERHQIPVRDVVSWNGWWNGGGGLYPRALGLRIFLVASGGGR